MAKSEEIKKRTIEMNELYNKGATMMELATKYNIAFQTVNKYILNPRIPGVATTLESEDLEEMNRLYNSGATMMKLAKKYGKCASTISRYIWKPRAKGRVKKRVIA